MFSCLRRYKPVSGNFPPDTPLSPGFWRPWALCTRFLMGFTALCVTTYFGIDLLLYKCSMISCPMFDKQYYMPYMVYEVVPTAIGLSLGFLWAKTHHDILRLEPFFQMSEPGGALAEDSILLDYPYIFPLLVPYLAWNRRHYAVLLSSCILLLVNFATVPLISGIFDNTRVTESTASNATRATAKIQDFQSYQFSTDFAYSLYSYQWLNGSLPLFTTPRYSVLPANISDSNADYNSPYSKIRADSRKSDKDHTTVIQWNLETTLFESELECVPAAVTPAYHPTEKVYGLNITNPLIDGYNCLLWAYNNEDDDSNRHLWAGCTTTANVWEKPTSYIYSKTRFITPWTSLVSVVGSSGGLETTMYAWGSTEESHNASPDRALLPQDLAAIFCKQHYYSQSVTVTVTTPIYEVTSVNRTSVRRPINGTNFAELFKTNHDDSTPPEYLDKDTKTRELGYRPSRAPDTRYQLERRFGPCPALNSSFQLLGSNKVECHVYIQDFFSLPAFAIYNHTRDTLVELLNPMVLIEVYQNAFQLLFAFAARELFDDQNTMNTIAKGHKEVESYIVNMQWSHGAQSSLVIVAILTILLALFNERRQSKLDGEPHSLVAGLQLLNESKDLCAQLHEAELLSEKDMREYFVKLGSVYRLRILPGSGPVIGVGFSDRSNEANEPLLAAVEEREEYKLQNSNNEPLLNTMEGREEFGVQNSNNQPVPTIPWVGRLRTGIGLIVSILLLIGLIVFLLFRSYSNAGAELSLFGGTSSFAYKFLYSYLPFIAGMSLEPILTTIGSYYCMLWPYETLRRLHEARVHDSEVKSPKRPNNKKRDARSKRIDAKSRAALLVDYDRSPPYGQLLRALYTRDFGLAAFSFAILSTNLLMVALSALFTTQSTYRYLSQEMHTHRAPTITGLLETQELDMYYTLLAYFGEDRAPLPIWTDLYNFVVPFYTKLTVDKDTDYYRGETTAFTADITCDVLLREHTLPVNNTGSQTVNLSTMLNGTCLAAEPLRPGEDQHMFELKTYGLSNMDKLIHRERCPGELVAAWLEQDSGPSPDYPTTDIVDHYHITLLYCNSSVELSVVEGFVLPTGYILYSTANITYLDLESSSKYGLINSFIQSLSPGTQVGGVARDELSWFTHTMSITYPEILSIRRNLTHLPDSDYLAYAFQDTFRLLFAIKLSLNSGVISYGDTSVTVGKVAVFKLFVMMRPIQFITSVSVLGYIVVALCLIYIWRRPQITGHLPTSLAGMYVSLHASNAKGPWRNGGSPGKRAKGLSGGYGYGEYIGLDGRAHKGVFREEMAR